MHKSGMGTRENSHDVGDIKLEYRADFGFCCLEKNQIWNLQSNGNLELTEGDFPGRPEVKNPLCNAKAFVPSLLREPRFHVLWGGLACGP